MILHVLDRRGWRLADVAPERAFGTSRYGFEWHGFGNASQVTRDPLGPSKSAIKALTGTLHDLLDRPSGPAMGR